MIYDEVVIGWSVRAALLAYHKGCPFINTRAKTHRIRDYISYDWDNYEIYSVEPERFELKTNLGIYKVGLFKGHLFKRLVFFLSLMGKYYQGRVFVTDEGVDVVTDKSGTRKLSVSQVHIVDAEQISGIESNCKPIENRYIVYDCIRCPVKKNPYDLLFSGYKKIAQELWFCETFSSEKYEKDLVAVSFLTRNEIFDSQYSDTMIRLFLEDILKKKGIEPYQKMSYVDRFWDEDFKYLTEDTEKMKFWLTKTETEILELPMSEEVSKFVSDLMTEK